MLQLIWKHERELPDFEHFPTSVAHSDHSGIYAQLPTLMCPLMLRFVSNTFLHWKK